MKGYDKSYGKLIDKIDVEYGKFKENLMRSPPEEIFDAAQKIEHYSFITNEFNMMDIGEEHSAALFGYDNLLETMHQRYFEGKVEPTVEKLREYILDMAVEARRKNNNPDKMLRDRIAEEFKQQANHYGYSVETTDHPAAYLAISHQGETITYLSKGLDLLSIEEKTIDLSLLKLLEDVKEYVAAIEDAPFFQQTGNGKTHKLLCDYNNTVLAVKYLESANEYEFVTWQYTYNKSAVTLGHYIYDYNAAKRDFAVRAGLIDKKELFSKEEINQLHSACCFYAMEGEGIDSKDYNRLTDLIEKIDFILPPSKEDNISCENTEEMESEQ